MFKTDFDFERKILNGVPLSIKLKQSAWTSLLYKGPCLIKVKT